MRIFSAFLVLASLSPLFSDLHTENSDCSFFKPCNPKYYVGVGAFSLDSFSLKDNNTDTDERASALATTTATDDINDPGVGFWGVVGYQFNKMLAFEFAYRQLAWKAKVNRTKTYTPDPLGESYNYNDISSLIYFGPSLLIAFPFNCYFAPYVKTGMVFRYLKERTSNIENAPFNVNYTLTHWKVDYTQGFGVRSDLTDSFNIRLEYETPFFDNQPGNFSLIACYAF